jgi:Flp pilus assembly protein TadD
VDTNEGVRYAAQADRLAQGPDFAAALAAYDQAIKHGFTNAAVFRNRGVMLMRLSRNAESAAALKQAIDLDPKNPELYRYYGIMLYNSGRQVEGTQAIHRSAELDPNNADTQNLLKQLAPKPPKP